MENGKQPITPINYDAAYSSEGLTKREYFAVLAMQGMLSNPATYGDREIMMIEAVKNADALLAELETFKQQEQ
jgi:hypothetical protein